MGVIIGIRRLTNHKTKEVEFFGAAISFTGRKTTGSEERNSQWRRSVIEQEGVLVDGHLLKLRNLFPPLEAAMDLKAFPGWMTLAEAEGRIVLTLEGAKASVKAPDKHGALGLRLYSVFSGTPYMVKATLNHSEIYRHWVTASESHFVSALLQPNETVDLELVDRTGLAHMESLCMRMQPVFLEIEGGPPTIR